MMPYCGASGATTNSHINLQRKLGDKPPWKIHGKHFSDGSNYPHNLDNFGFTIGSPPQAMFE